MLQINIFENEVDLLRLKQNENMLIMLYKLNDIEVFFFIVDHEQNLWIIYNMEINLVCLL